MAKSLRALKLLCVLVALLPQGIPFTCLTDEEGPPNLDGRYFNERAPPTGWNKGFYYDPQYIPHECCTNVTEGRRIDYPNGTIGGHRTTEATLANEGRSFCLMGEHIVNTGLANAPQLVGFYPLLAYNLDIGNHIMPNNMARMNTVKLQNYVTQEPSLTARKNYKYEQTACKYTGLKVNPEPDPEHSYYWSRPAIQEKQPDPSCVNPYEVVVTEIHSHDIRLHNYLHVEVVAQRITRPNPKKRCPTGKMKWLMLEARDQRGLPVGHFTNDVPCDAEMKGRKAPPGPGGIPGKAVFGFDTTHKNILPCMYAPRDAVSHPGIFLVSETGGYFTEAHATWRFAQHTSDFISEIHFVALVVEDATPIRYFTSRKENFRATNRCNARWVCEFETNQTKPGQYERGCLHKNDTYPREPKYMNFTKFEWFWGENDYRKYQPEQDFYDKPDTWELTDGGWNTDFSYSVCALSHEENVRPYGYIAKKKVLFPQMSTLGGWDYIRKDYVVPDYVECHVPLSSAYFTQSEDFAPNPTWMLRNGLKNNLPNNFETYGVESGLNSKDKIMRDPAPQKELFMGEPDRQPWKQVHRFFQKDKVKLHTLYSLDTKYKTYFGTKNTHKAYLAQSASPNQNQQAQEIAEQIRKFKFASMEAMGEGERCPCPAFATTPKPEFQTKPPLELDGRRLHAAQMLIAWVVLIPIALFSSRYYKETFSRVFFMREFWWYTVHVLTLFTALVFMIGGVYVSRLNRETTQVDTLNIKLHVGFGWAAIVLFVLQLITGPFRALKPSTRQIQLTLHWLFGMVEYILGVSSIFVAGAIKQSFLNCVAFDLFVAFLCVQVLFHVIMDVQMRISDKKMRLRPPRSYFPPPVMRVFHTDAPYAKFRMLMLFLYYLTCIGFYVAIRIAINRQGQEEACYEPDEVKSEFVET